VPSGTVPHNARPGHVKLQFWVPTDRGVDAISSLAG